MRELFRDLPVAVENSARLAERLEFTLEKLGYEFPTYSTPGGESMDAYLRAVTFACAPRRIPEGLSASLVAQVNRELELIARLKFSGYFLIVWDICRWARERGILVQGRGSAANSAVCYLLGITAVNPVRHHLLFDRFLNDSRIGADGNPSWPDIDLDLPSGDRRESVIQEVYNRYGRRGAAMTANVITYRGRSVVREAGKVLGFGDDALDRFSGLYANGDFPETLQLQQQLTMSGIAANHPRTHLLAQLYQRIHGLPRHLGQHSGGMVICQGQLDHVVPLEPASMPERTVCQWDKDDCENLGIVKIDFLGLGMMAVMQETIELCAKRADGPRTLDDIPENDPFTYEKIRAADTVGVFQIESRAQMATLPRFKPKDLYDLAMQVALVRPGPITGHLVHPLIRRRDGLEHEDYIDPSVEELVKPILGRTKGVILFQEQMLELSMTLAKFTGAQAEELRRAMGFTKNAARLTRALDKLATALRAAGRNETVIKKVCESAQSFAAYGFPESHAIGFAMLAYASTWLKLHRPAEFYASLLNNQPMGFYSPATLLQDAKREERKMKTLPACVQTSDWTCTVVDAKTIRIGLRYVKGVREAAVQDMLVARKEKPFASMDDFLRRTNFNAADRRALAAVGALNCFSSHRRAAMWQVETAWSEQEALFKYYGNDREPADCMVAEQSGAPDAPSSNASPLAPMTLGERLRADFGHMGLTTGRHPMALLRARLPGVFSAADLKQTKTGDRVTIAGSVICRQRPGTASGIVFVSLEDETGIANAVVMPQIFEANRLVITQESALRITGPVQNVANVIHVKAEVIEPLREDAVPAQASHDFH
jgi:error-prone DNA polymerase